MTEPRVTLPHDHVRSHLPRVHDHISRANSDRLDRILELFNAPQQTVISLESCLDAVAPLKKDDRQKQQADLRQFRQHLKKSFDQCGLGIELTVDSRKRDIPADRECWFTGPPINRTVEQVEQFSESAASSDGIEPVEPRGVNSNLIGRLAARCCVLSAEGDNQLAAKLVDLLKRQLLAQAEFAYDVWSRDSVVAGENLRAQQQAAADRADVVLTLVSPSFLADQELRSLHEARSESVIPVSLKPIAETQDQVCLADCELFAVKLARSRKPFERCDGPQRETFAQQLFSLVQDRMLALRRLQKPVLSQDSAAFNDETARELTELFVANDPDDPIEPRGTQARFGEDVTKRKLDSEAAGSVLMFDALEAWVHDPNAAVYAAILGESGIGKTTLLKQMTLRMIDQRKQDRSLPLPIYIDLRLFVPTIQEQKKVPTNLVELLDEVLGRATHRGDVSGISGEDIVRMVQQDGAILIFDGLDEKLVHLDENQGMALMRVLWEALPFSVVRKQRREAAVRHGRVVFSCRSHYFKSLREQNALFLGEEREELAAKDYCAWVLLPFNEDQVREYLRRQIGEDKVEPAIELFRSVHNLEDLSGRPLLLSMMVPQIDALEQKRLRGEPVFGVTLYDMLVERWLHRDGGKHHIRPEDKVTLMQNISAAMWADGRREWNWNEVRDWLATQLVRTDVLRARYRDIAFEILEEDFRTATFVLRPSQSLNSFRFAHTSLQEYFLACFLKECLLNGESAGWNLPLPSMETLEFLGQLIAVEKNGEQEDERRYERCLQTLSGILSREHDGGLQAAVVAFRYWLLAIEKELPEPTPRQVNLAGANLYGLHIKGRLPDRRLNLVRANLQGCNLRSVRFENVDLSGADLSGVQGEAAEFLNVQAPRVNIADSDLTGSLWRRSNVSGMTGRDSATLRSCHWLDCRLDGLLIPSLLADNGVVSDPATPQTSHPVSSRAGLHTFEGHSSNVLSCGFSPDGTSIV
ncbi:MAG: NACHT domain-containing protein, partial [Planctomycetales bacterium]